MTENVPFPENATGTHTDNANPADFTQELRSTQRSAKALLSIIDTEAVRNIGLDDQAVEELEAFAEAKIPTARALARAALVGAVDSNGIYLLWSRARKAFMAAAPAVMDMFPEKMEKGPGCRYSERLLVEAMKGTGMLTQSEPVNEDDRAAMMTNEEVRGLSDEDLRRKLLGGTRDGD
jgi:hypothetical protein